MTFSKQEQLARSPKKPKRATCQDIVNGYMAFTKTLPCFISGGHDRVEAAHIYLPKRLGMPTTPRKDKSLDRTHTTHRGLYGLYCIPLEWKYHSQQSPYEFSFHKIGQKAFFSHHEISEAEVFAFLAETIATYFLKPHMDFNEGNLT